MLFSSTIFLFLFLPVCLLVYGFARRRFRNLVLLGFSLFFYYYGEAEHIYILLSSIFINYFGALLVALPFSRGGDNDANLFHKFALIVTVALNLATLGYFKYFNFATENLAWFANHYNFSSMESFVYGFGKVALPLGISFFTFQAISYVVDVYRREVRPNYNPVSVAAYISMFPQLVAGPIVRYSDINHELQHRKYSIIKFSEGIFRFSVGMAKKLIIADSLGLMSDSIFALDPGQMDFQLSWYATICYSFQIYFDFSGYSDMAIGLGYMFGFKFPENFNYPYISRSIREFWHRWHMTLSSWFRDYLYIPLGGNRHGGFRTSLNLLIVFALCGLWHGAEWIFLIWGLWHGVFLMLERTRFGSWIGKLPKPVQHLYTILVFSFGWVWFKSASVVQALSFFQAMLGLKGFANKAAPLASYTSVYHTLIIAFALLCSLPVLPYIADTFKKRQWVVGAVKLILGGTCLLLAVMSVINGKYSSFLYFRF